MALLWAVSGVASLELAAVFAVLWASGSPYISSMNGVYICGSTLLFLGAGLLVRGREGAGIALVLLGGATRPEILLWAGATGIVAAFVGRRILGWFLAAAAGALLVLQLTADESRQPETAEVLPIGRSSASEHGPGRRQPACLRLAKRYLKPPAEIRLPQGNNVLG